MELKDELTVLVCTCDNYEDLWYPFFKLLKTYWPSLQCKIILNTEDKKYSYDGLDIECFQLGPAKYGERMLMHLTRIETKYTLLLLDDFFIRKEVKEETLLSMMRVMDGDDSIAAFEFDKNPYCEREKILGHFSKLNRYAPYKLNMQAGIWRTSSLLKYWQPNDNPWIWEIFVNFTTFDNNDIFYTLDDYENSPIYYGFNPEGMGVFRGKWVLHDVRPLFEKHNIEIDFSKRGIYDAENAVSRLPIMSTMPYVFNRIPFRYALGFSTYELWKRVLRLFGKKSKYLNYQVFLASTRHN